MTIALSNNFFLNARGLTFEDGNGFTWALNKSTNQITLAGSGSGLSSATTADSIQGAGTAASPIELVGDSAAPGNLKYYGTNGSGTKGWYTSTTVPTSANPSATIGLTAVNGTAATFMTSDSAPALNVGISPTWTGVHQFTSTTTTANLTVKAIGGQYASLTVLGNAQTTGLVLYQFTDNNCYVNAQQGSLNFQTASGATRMTITSGGAIQCNGNFSCNGNTPPAQSTGWGTPTGGSVQNNFSGSAASLLTLGPAVAQIIAVLKAVGILGA